MAKSNAIAAFDPTQLAAPSKKPLAEMKDNAEQDGYLKRLQLFSKGKFVDEQKVRGGEYGIPNGDDVDVIGSAVDLIILAVRDKAMDVGDSNNITTSFDAASSIYADIMEQSKVTDSGCMYGPSFLVLERKSGKLLEFYCSSKSARRTAGTLLGYLANDGKGPIPVTLSSSIVKKPRYSWFVSNATPCKAEFSKVPPMEDLNAAIAKFLDETGSEVAPEGATAGRDR